MNWLKSGPQNPRIYLRGAESKDFRTGWKKGGFSLVEAMMGAGVLTLVLAGCFNGLGQSILISENVKSYNFSAQLLQCEMETVRALQWDEVASLSNGSFDPTVYFTNVPLRDYSCQRLISNKGSDQKEIRLTVTWKDLRGISHSREYVSYYSKEGLSDYYYRAL